MADNRQQDDPARTARGGTTTQGAAAVPGQRNAPPVTGDEGEHGSVRVVVDDTEAARDRVIEGALRAQQLGVALELEPHEDPGTAHHHALMLQRLDNLVQAVREVAPGLDVRLPTSAMSFEEPG